MEALAGGITTLDEDALLASLNRLRKELEAEKMNVIGTFKGTKGLDLFLKDEGVKLYESPDFIKRRVEINRLGDPNIEGRNFLDTDQGKITFIDGKRYRLDPKTGTFKYMPDKKKSQIKK